MDNLLCLVRKRRTKGRKKIETAGGRTRITNGYLVQCESGLAAHVLEKQLGDLHILPTAGKVQCRIAILLAQSQKNRHIISITFARNTCIEMPMYAYG